MERKPPLKARIFYIYLLIGNVRIGMCERFWNSKLFMTKFAEECVWYSKVSQIRTKFEFFGKKLGALLEKLDFFKIGKGDKFAVECVSNVIF